jgi:oxalate decarboxylase/phosphoglucose isomerase-like protein (cupin superfamily)
VVCCIIGSAVTLVGPDLDPVAHGPGEMIYIPEGVAHVAVNLSTSDTLVAIEMRTDPAFNDDVVLLPELEAAAALAAAAAQARHRAAGPAALPAVWDTCGPPGRAATAV